MELGNLTVLDVLNGVFSLIFVIISLIIGLKLVFKYYTYKKNELIAVGLTWIFLSSAWWGIVILFLLYVLFSYRISTFFYLLIGNIFVPLALLCWIYAFSSMVYPMSKKKILSIFLAICIPYDVVLVIFLFINPNLIGHFKTEFYLESELYPTVFQIFAVLTAIITGILFTKNALKSEDPKVRLKGKFLLLAFITFSFASFCEAIILLDPLTLVIMRIILISSSIIYYLGFFLPEKLEDWLISRRIS